MSEDSIVIGKFGRPHGVRGEIRLWISNPESTSVRDGVRLTCSNGKEVVVDTVRQANKYRIATIQGFNDCDEVAILTNLEFSISREDFPDDLEEDEFYQIDMIGLPVQDVEGNSLGEVGGFLDNVATDVMVVKGKKRLLVPMLKTIVLTISLETGVTLAPVDTWAAPDDEEE